MVVGKHLGAKMSATGCAWCFVSLVPVFGRRMASLLVVSRPALATM